MSRILLVDDDQDLLGAAKILLTREEPTLDVVTATSAQEALKMLLEASFDVGSPTTSCQTSMVSRSYRISAMRIMLP